MSKTSKNRNEYQDYPSYRSYLRRNHNYSLSHDKFVVPWQMESYNQKSKDPGLKKINEF